MTRVAAIDCGTNSVRLLVADVEPGRPPSEVTREMHITRLGQGVDRTGRLAPDALERTVEVVRGYAATLRDLGAVATRMVATSATRDAANREEFVARVRAVLGADPEVVSGDEEAALSFAGATGALPPGAAAPFLVVDIGGGSTEFVLGDREPMAARSVDIGCVRLTERHLTGDPPTGEQVAAAEADIDAALEQVREVVDLDAAATLVGLAGSVTTVAAIALGLARYDRDAIHHARVPAAAVCSVSDRLLSMSHDERAALAVVHPGRVDVIAAGALVLATVVDRLGLDDVLVSEHDILDGIALSAAAAAARAGGS